MLNYNCREVSLPSVVTTAKAVSLSSAGRVLIEPSERQGAWLVDGERHFAVLPLRDDENVRAAACSDFRGGTVIGYSGRSPAVWYREGDIMVGRALPVPDHLESAFPRCVDNLGRVYGDGVTGQRPERWEPVAWDAIGNSVEVPLLDQKMTRCSAVSPNGRFIVGKIGDLSALTPVIWTWTVEGALKVACVLEECPGDPHAVMDDGKICGRINVGSNSHHASVWIPDEDGNWKAHDLDAIGQGRSEIQFLNSECAVGLQTHEPDGMLVEELFGVWVNWPDGCEIDRLESLPGRPLYNSCAEKDEGIAGLNEAGQLLVTRVGSDFRDRRPYLVTLSVS